MVPCVFRWVLPALALATSAIGCSPPEARTYAVVLEEPAALDCSPVITSPDIDLGSFVQQLHQIQAQWADRHHSGALRPSGGALHVVPQGERVRAWLGDFQQDPYDTWNGAVFEGDLHPDYLEVTTQSFHNYDVYDPNDVVPDCGDLVDAEGELLATLDGPQIEGRIQRVEYLYFASAASACGAYIACARNLSLSGVLDD